MSQLPQSERFANQLKMNTFKTIYQGQPSNITMYNILSDKATINFTQIGNPINCFVELTAGGSSHTFTVEGGLTECLAVGLLPNTTYVVDITANYTSGQQFSANATKSFKTLDKWKVSSVTLDYPRNRTPHDITDQNYNHTQIDLSFGLSPGIPTQYVVTIDTTGYRLVIPFSYLLSSQQIYQINIRNDISSNLTVNTEYSDISFATMLTVEPSFEGTSVFELFVRDTQQIDISYSKAPGSPIYKYYISEGTGVYVAHTMSVSEEGNAYATETIKHLKLYTEYTIYLETYYESTNNTYTNGNRILCRTLNHSFIQNVRCESTPTTLAFSFESPIGEFTVTPTSYLKMTLTDEADIVILNEEYLPNTTTSKSYRDLSVNEVYTWTVIAYYVSAGTFLPYTFEKTYQTLYEGKVENVFVSDPKGTSVDISFSPFTAPNSISPSKPDYYIIECVNLSTNSTTDIIVLNTYVKANSIENALVPSTLYDFHITAVYSTGNIYKVTGNNETTKNEGSFKTLAISRLKGNLVEFEWTLYPGVPTPDTLQMEIYYFTKLVKTVDLSYNDLRRLVPDPAIDVNFNIYHASEYTFNFISTYNSSNNVYKRSLNATTLNEYKVNLNPTECRADSLTVSKSSSEPNNQDEYFIIRDQSPTDKSTFVWAAQSVASGEKYFAGPKIEFFTIEMCKSSRYLLFCQNNREIQVLRKSSKYNKFGLETGSVYTKIHTQSFTRNIHSLSINYEGTVFIVGYNNLEIAVFDISGSTVSYRNKTITVVGTTSKNVVISPAGNVCAASNESLLDCVFVVDLSSNKYFEYTIPNISLSHEHWFTSTLNKYVQFDEFGYVMAVGIELFYYSLDVSGSDNKVDTTSVRVLDLDQNSSSFTYIDDRKIDVSGSRISLNKTGTKLAVVYSSDISSNVSIYDVSDTALTNKKIFWGTNTATYPIYRNCSINDDGDVIAISEYNFRYKTNNIVMPTSDGQILVYELSGNATWVERGNPIRLTNENVPPYPTSSASALPGEWFGSNIILDASGAVVLASTRSKMNMGEGYSQGKGFIYNWRYDDIIYQYDVTNWPIKISSLIPGITYSFTIYSVYKDDLTYHYPLLITASTLKGQAPDVSYSISSTSVTANWPSVPRPTFYQDITDSFYRVVVTNLDTKVIEHNESLLIAISDYNHDMTGLSYNTSYHIKVASEYKIKNTNSSEPVEYAAEIVLKTLDERASNVSKIVQLNSDQLVVLLVENENAIEVSYNLLSLNIKSNTKNYDISYLLVNSNSFVDISNVTNGDLISGNVYTVYKEMSNNNVDVVRKNGKYTSAPFSFTVSYESVPDKLVENGSFLPKYTSDLLIPSYNTVVVQKTRFPVDISKGLWRVIPPYWDLYSNYVFAIENKADDGSSYLNVPNIGYHAFLYRSIDLFLNVNPSNLSQTLNGIMFGQLYNNSFYIKNQDISTSVYNSQNNFSDSIQYKIAFSTIDTNGNDVTFYETSPLTNYGISWEQINLNVKFPISRQNIKYTIRRLGTEYNSLYISDVSMTRPQSYNDSSSKILPFYDFSGGSSSWTNIPLATSFKNWTDTWTGSGAGMYRSIKLSCNMSISIWCYLHYTDTSLCVFLLGTDLSNGTPCIYVDNSNIIVQNKYDSSANSTNVVSRYSTPSSVPTHFVVTYFNNTITTYVNGNCVKTVDTLTPKIQEAAFNYKIYNGSSIANMVYGVVIRSVQLYDYKMEASNIHSLYNDDDILKFGIGNPHDISGNIISLFSNTNTLYTEPVSQYVLGRRTLTKKIPKTENFTATLVKDLSSVSMWVNSSSQISFNDGTNTKDCYFDTSNNLMFMTTQRIPLSSSTHHIALTFSPNSTATTMKLYINGYFYLTYEATFLSTTSISGTNLGEVVIWNKILAESEVLTSYYNYFNLYSTYDVSGGKYHIYVKYPSPTTTTTYDISYELSSSSSSKLQTDFSLNSLTGIMKTDFSSNYVNKFMALTASSDYYYTTGFELKLDDITRNTFNKKPYTIHVVIPEYNVNHDLSGLIAPYIEYNYSNVQYLNENITLKFWLGNYHSSDISCSYTISGELSNMDISTNVLTGTIKDISNQVSIVIGQKLTSDHVSSIMFNVPYLGLATQLEIYDSIYFVSSSRYAVEHDVFTISMRNSLRRSGLNYRISGVESSDISGANLTGIFDVSYMSDVTVIDSAALSYFDISFLVTAGATTRTNLPFKLTLTDPDLTATYGNLDITVLLNDYFTTSMTISGGGILKEGGSFTIYLKTPHYIVDDTSFTYTIQGISDHFVEKADVAGNMLSYDLSASKTFEMAYTADVYDVSMITVAISGSGLAYSFVQMVDISLTHIVPIFDLSGPVFVDEDISFSLYLIDLSQNLPVNTTLGYTVIGKSSLFSEHDLSWNNSAFVFDANHIATVTCDVIGHSVTTGNKPFYISVDNYPTNFLHMEIINTSLSPLLNLTTTSTRVSAGESFTITLSYVNVRPGKVWFDVSGKNISTVDFAGTAVRLHDYFTIPGDLTRSYTMLDDNTINPLRNLNFTLVENPDVSIDISVNATLGPFYNLMITDTQYSANYNFNPGSTVIFDLSTNQIATGSKVVFRLSNIMLSNIRNIIPSNSVSYDNINNCLKLMFTVGYNSQIQFDNSGNALITSYITCDLPLVYVNYDYSSAENSTLLDISSITLKAL